VREYYILVLDHYRIYKYFFDGITPNCICDTRIDQVISLSDDIIVYTEYNPGEKIIKLVVWDIVNWMEVHLVQLHGLHHSSLLHGLAHDLVLAQTKGKWYLIDLNDHPLLLTPLGWISNAKKPLISKERTIVVIPTNTTRVYCGLVHETSRGAQISWKTIFMEKFTSYALLEDRKCFVGIMAGTLYVYDIVNDVLEYHVLQERK